MSDSKTEQDDDNQIPKSRSQKQQATSSSVTCHMILLTPCIQPTFMCVCEITFYDFIHKRQMCYFTVLAVVIFQI